MTLNRFDVPIGRPCPARWDQMVGDDLTRYCRGCHQPVHDLSARSSAAAKAFLRANPTACVRYTYDQRTGAILHRAAGCSRARARIVGRRLRIGALVGLVLAAPAAAVGRFALALLGPDRATGAIHPYVTSMGTMEVMPFPEEALPPHPPPPLPRK